MVHYKRTAHKVTFLLANFRSLLKKVDILKTLILACDADIIIGTETWLTEHIADNELSLPKSFVVFRKDRKVSRGGGVIIAVKKEFQPSLIPINSPLEMVWIVTRHCHVHCVIGSCYRPPDSQPDFVDLFNDAIEQVTNKFPNAILVLAGDFNYPAIDWLTPSVLGNNNRQEYLHFLQTVHLHNLSQLVKNPTRGENILDLIFTNHPEYGSALVLEEISDHRAVHCTLELPRPKKQKK